MSRLPPGPRCQSCGMPMSLDGGGSEMDGSAKSIEFCARCYKDGRFVDPDITVDEMIATVQTRLVAMGVPDAVVEKNLMAVYSLDRWRET